MKRFLLLSFPLILGVSYPVLAQALRIDSLPPQGILLDKGWRWHTGDNPDWARPSLDDSHWATIDPTNDIDYLPQIRQAGFGWFRLRLRVDPGVANTIVRLNVNQILASEIYLDGHRIATYGKVSRDPNLVEAYNPAGEGNSREFIFCQLGTKIDQVLAIRFALEPSLYYGRAGISNPCLRMQFSKAGPVKAESVDIAPIEFIKIGLFFILALLHLTFYFSFRTQIASLYFGLYCLASSMYFLLEQMTLLYTHTVAIRMSVNVILLLIYMILPLLFIKAIYMLVSYQNRRLYALLISYAIILFLLIMMKYTRAEFLELGYFLGRSFPVLLWVLHRLGVKA